jgi:hypothetical protein
MMALTLCATGIGTSAASAATACPQGSTYNKQTKACERPPTIVCPTASTYDPTTGLCIGPVSPPNHGCSEGYSYNPTSNRCEVSVCPAGSAWTTRPDGSLGCTAPDGTVVFLVPCPPNPDPFVPPFGSLDPNTGICSHSSTAPSCGAGLTLDSGGERCLAVPGFACPQGYGYNSLTGKCQAVPAKGPKP